MIYTLKDDRIVEYNYMYDNLPIGLGYLLDLGSPASYPTNKFALERGYSVMAVDLRGNSFEDGRFEFRAGDFLEMEFNEKFDWILNISSIEHFGLVGRYGVTVEDEEADLRAMAKLRSIMKLDATMLLTVPVGLDEIIHPLHRVYGQIRLPELLRGYRIVSKEFWGKFGGIDKYQHVEEDEALSTKVQCRDTNSQLAKDHYYAIGCFALRLKDV